MKTMSEKADAQSAAGVSISCGAAVQEGAHAEGIYHFECVGPSDADRPRYILLRDAIMAREARVERAAVKLRTAQGTLWSRVLAWFGITPKRVAALRAHVEELVSPLERLQQELAAIPLHRQWSDVVHNTVLTEGKNALLTHGFKGSSYTAAMFMGLIEDTGYSSIAAGNTAANITAAGSGSPTNGWNEAQSSTCASRGTPSFGTASAGALALSTPLSFAILATDTIKGVFLLIRSAAGTAPTSTVGNTNGAIYSAGLFTGGDRAVVNGDTINVSYSASL